MDRDRIERRDFPTGRRGYDPAAVDEHLRRVADEFEAHVHAPAPSMAASTSEQVRLILEAAERGAAELRTAAGAEASDHVSRVQEAADGMLAKLDALESELTRLLSALRTSGERLVEGLAELQAEAAIGPRRRPSVEFVAQSPTNSTLDRSPPRTRARRRRAAAPAVARGRRLVARAAVARRRRFAARVARRRRSARARVAAPPPTRRPSPLARRRRVARAAAARRRRLAGRARVARRRRRFARARRPRPSSPPAPRRRRLVARARVARRRRPPPTTLRPRPRRPPPTLRPPTATLSRARPRLAAPLRARRPRLARPSTRSSSPGARSSPRSRRPEPEDAGARLIALNMALGGSRRDDTRVFLEEHFSLPDVEALLDDVYARAGR